MLTPSEEQYYSRQIRLSNLGSGGQEKLKNSRILVVGAGGLGCSALTYLAAAGVGRLGVCEYDRVEISNLHRQPLYCLEDEGQPKGEKAIEKLKKQNPWVNYVWHSAKLSPMNSKVFFQQYDLVLDCTDNFTSKFLINDTAVITKTPVIQSSIYQYEGQFWGYAPGKKSPCLRCLWPSVPEEDCIGTCQEVGVLGAIPGVFGTIQALEAIKWLLGLPNCLQTHEMILFNLLSYRIEALKRTKSLDCTHCSATPLVQTISTSSYSNPTIPWLVEESTVTQWKPEMVVLVDLRTPQEVNLNPIEVSGFVIEHLPISETNFDTMHMDLNKQYVFMCESGCRSKVVVKSLRNKEFTNTFSLVGGVNALNKIFRKELIRC